MTTQNAYPLSWPPAWARTPRHKITYSHFGRSGGSYNRGHSMERVVRELLREIDLLGGDGVVISTNVKLRNDGLPYSGLKRPDDCGVAVYFTLKKRPCVLACDRWDRVECNLWAIAKDIEAQRGRIRWGVGSVEQAFAGYTALPAPGDSTAATWYNVLGVSADAPYEAALEAYRREAMKCHPDRPNGSHDSMSRLNASWDQARLHFGR